MKRRPLVIITCIASLCFAGLCLTLFTQSYIHSHSSQTTAGRIIDTAEEAETEAAVLEAELKEKETDSESDEINAEPEALAEVEPLTEDTKKSAEVLIALEEDSVQSETQAALVVYLEHLAEVEAQIDASWMNLETSQSKPTVQQEKTVADLAYQLWDDELNIIYKKLREMLPEEEFEILKKEEKLWLKERDQTAENAVAGISNPSVQSLQYTLSLAETTKDRTYVLVELYFKEE